MAVDRNRVLVIPSGCNNERYHELYAIIGKHLCQYKNREKNYEQ